MRPWTRNTIVNGNPAYGDWGVLSFVPMLNPALGVSQGTVFFAKIVPKTSSSPSTWLSLVMARSPSKTWISTAGWLSWYVENTLVFLVGMTLFRSMIFVIMPPTVSIPWGQSWCQETNHTNHKDVFRTHGNGMAIATNLATPSLISSAMSYFYLFAAHNPKCTTLTWLSATTSSTMTLSFMVPPPMMSPWTAAPYATASSGLIPRDGSLPLNLFFRSS